MVDNSNQIKKDRREWTIMNLFASAYGQFPIGTTHKSERPDFQHVTIDNKRIGIELTELKYDRNATEFNMRAHEDFLSEIMNTAEEIFSKKNSFCLVVDVHFSEKIAPHVSVQPSDNEAKLIKLGHSETIARIVEENLPESTGKKYIVDRNSKYGDINLPRFIESIHITNVCGRFEEPLWYASISTRVKPLSIESISQRINNKDAKIKNYDQSCDEMWLVIIQNSFLMSSYYNPVAVKHALDHRYRSRFDRVFVFERSNLQVKRLNLIKKIGGR